MRLAKPLLLASLMSALALPIAARAVDESPSRHSSGGGAWLGVGTGLMSGAVDEPCPTGGRNDCSEAGVFQSYNANVTFAGPAALRFRGMRAAGRESHGRTPYETAAMIGPQLGDGGTYFLIGGGRIQHADDGFDRPTEGVAWELLFASAGPATAGLEASLMGNFGPDVDFVGFNVGARFGTLR